MARSPKGWGVKKTAVDVIRSNEIDQGGKNLPEAPTPVQAGPVPGVVGVLGGLAGGWAGQAGMAYLPILINH